MESDLKFEQVLDKMLDAVLLVDLETRIIYANPAVRVYGYEPSYLIGKKILDFIPEKYQKNVFDIIKRFIDGETESYRLEIEIPKKSGELRWTDVVISKIDNYRAVLELRDITELKRVQKELEESKETYKTIFEAYPDFIAVVDVDGKILNINQNFLKRYKIDENRVLGASVLSFVHPEELEKTAELLKKATESRGIIRSTIKGLVKGEELIVDVAIRYIKSGKKTFGIIVGKDIIDKARLEEELKRREELYRNIIDSNLAGLLLIENFKIIFANKAVTKITGYSEEELLGKSADIFFEPEDVENFKKAVKDILEGNKIDIISRFRRKDGERGYVRIMASLMEYKGRKLILTSFEDITDKREIEKKLEERNILYRTLVESSHTGIFIIQDNKIVFANEVVARMLGYTIDEINSLPHPYSIISPEFREIAMERYRAREKGLEVPDSYELKVITKDGKEKWLKVLAKRIKYKGSPAVMVNIADITSIKENEEMLKRMNTLLRVAGEIKGMLIQEKSEINIFSKLKSCLEKLDAKVLVYYSNGVHSQKKDLLWNLLDSVRDKINAGEVIQKFVDGKWLTFLPIYENRLHSVLILKRSHRFTEDELRVISTIAQDVSMRLKALKVEKEQERALKLIMENLEQFEELADKLRNPLAVIKGYLEIRDEVPEEEVIKNIWEHANRIEKILDELRFKELATYQMKKILESRDFN
ncbi:MAG: PAS domain S-box protein [Archaeoglobaceae archaeon]